jgi:hypothetical protein
MILLLVATAFTSAEVNRKEIGNLVIENIPKFLQVCRSG